MKHGSLFSGIGGFDLAAQWMGWDNVFHCEVNQFCSQVLKHNFKNSISYEDITTTDFTVHRGSIDIISGGFPCQPFSNSGHRKGTEDSRYLWPEMLRAIREVRPSWVVGENVSGLVNWNDGLVLDTVCSDLENEGYTVLPVVLPAASVGAEHKRERIWFIAHSNSQRLEGHQRKDRSQQTTKTYPPITRLSTHREDQDLRQDYGVPIQLDRISFPKWTRESMKGYGNAIVPQVAFNIFKTIDALWS